MIGFLFILIGAGYVGLGVDQLFNGRRRKFDEERRFELKRREVEAIEESNRINAKQFGGTEDGEEGNE